MSGRAAGRIAGAFWACLLLSGSGHPGGALAAEDPRSPGRHSGTLRHGGRERSFEYRLPPGFDAAGVKRYPLLLALHGGGGRGRSMASLAGGLEGLADREGLILVMPDGVRRQWNDGRKAVDSYAHRSGVDDLGFLRELTGSFIRDYAADPKRVYATGMSNGAFMSFRLACAAADVFAAIAPVTGSLPAEDESLCAPSRPVPVLMINGAEDPLVGWGDRVVRQALLRGKTRSRKRTVPETAAFWARADGCGPEPRTEERPDRDPEDGTRVSVQSWSGCAGGSEVVLYRVEGGGHTWPGGTQYLPRSLIGRTSREFDASETVWGFFSRHRLP